jgi:mannosyl-oligosaccharide glucosidase
MVRFAAAAARPVAVFSVCALAVGISLVLQLQLELPPPSSWWTGGKRKPPLLVSLGSPGGPLWRPGDESFTRRPDLWLHPWKLLDAEASYDPAYLDEMLWGTYRPGVYLGFKTRTAPASVVGGLMWHGEDSKQLRHQAKDGELSSWGWLKHDGRSYGRQDFVERQGGLSLRTTFVKPLHEATDVHLVARVEVLAAPSSNTTLFFYVGVSCDGEETFCSDASGDGALRSVDQTSLTFVLASGGAIRNEVVGASAIPRGASLSGEVLSLGGVEDAESSARKGDTGERREEHAELAPPPEAGGGMLKMKGVGSWSVDFVVHSSASNVDISEETITSWMRKGDEAFDKHFDAAYKLRTRGFEGAQIAAGAAALSNMIGSMGYFYGKAVVQDAKDEAFAAPLFTCVPSRGVFPRGFLWDEGFHQLVVSTWDEEISLDVLRHWMGIMHEAPANPGLAWPPREQARGAEASGRVPREFLAQNPAVANPPALMLLVRRMLSEGGDQEKTLAPIAPALDAWMRWFLSTQSSGRDGSFQWKGRDPSDDRLNPLTLASGLDDYPRASIPNDDERHLDALCWAAFSCRVMADLQSYLPADAPPYSSLAAELEAAVLELHWAGDGFWDIGLHSSTGRVAPLAVVRCMNPQDRSTTDVSVAPPLSAEKLQSSCPPTHPQPMYPLGDGRGNILLRQRWLGDEPVLQPVRHFGYVSLFPVLLLLLDPSSDELGSVLQLMRDPDQLWSAHGLRSLSRADPFYRQPNNPGDEPYWRGAIWININFLALAALHHYSHAGGQWSSLAGQIYSELRGNVLRTALNGYRSTGFFYEQYDDTTGEGLRSHPFTGWTACILNIMAEKYPWDSSQS